MDTFQSIFFLNKIKYVYAFTHTNTYLFGRKAACFFSFFIKLFITYFFLQNCFLMQGNDLFCVTIDANDFY